MVWTFAGNVFIIFCKFSVKEKQIFSEIDENAELRNFRNVYLTFLIKHNSEYYLDKPDFDLCKIVVYTVLRYSSSKVNTGMS